MQSHVGREQSCNQCHKSPQGFDSPGPINLPGVTEEQATQTQPPPDGCLPTIDVTQ